MRLRSPSGALRHDHAFNPTVVLDDFHTLPPQGLLEQPPDAACLPVTHFHNGKAAVIQKLGSFRNEATVEQKAIGATL